MSNTALLERPATTAATRTQPEPAAPLPAAGADLPAVRSPRGFALYVGLDEIKAAEAGVSLPLLVDALRRTRANVTAAAKLLGIGRATMYRWMGRQRPFRENP